MQFHSISVIALTIAQTYYSVRLNIYDGGYLYLIALIFVFGILLFSLMQGSDWKMVVITTQSYPVSHVKAIKNMQKNEGAEPRTKLNISEAMRNMQNKSHVSQKMKHCILITNSSYLRAEKKFLSFLGLSLREKH